MLPVQVGWKLSISLSTEIDPRYSVDLRFLLFCKTKTNGIHVTLFFGAEICPNISPFLRFFSPLYGGMVRLHGLHMGSFLPGTISIQPDTT
jgi:hypothetical protein